jgi:tRNA-splicing ligase RtcB
MLEVITTEKLPIKLWVNDLEENTLEQAKNLANLPFTFKHIALMGDCHLGYGMPIGAILATEGVVIPNSVGVDIGCGMSVVKTPWTVDEIGMSILKKIMGRIREVVPLGMSHHKEEQDVHFLPDTSTVDLPPVVSFQYHSAKHQVGTLGSGNHFIEIQKDNDNFIYIMIHSGSRNLGKKVGDYYNKRAQVANHIWCSGVPKAWDLAHLPILSTDGAKYLTEMDYCVKFAKCNRNLIMLRIIESFEKEIKHKKVDLDGVLDIAHNYAALENHFNRNVLVHRKGAIRVRPGMLGIIPGSQGTKSYIVKGIASKGNTESFNSCSHGAGRKMGRNVAKKNLNLAEEIKKLDDQGIIHGIRNENDLDEASGAYKDIKTVMLNQVDLVSIVMELNPVAVIKG